jgi:hypothetical protein
MFTLRQVKALATLLIRPPANENNYQKTIQLVIAYVFQNALSYSFCLKLRFLFS